MLKPGIYRHRHETEYAEGTVHNGDILLEVRETKTSYVLTLLEQQVRYDAPQIDDLFQNGKRVVIRKNDPRHGLTLCGGQNDWFCLYPYRVGVPYAFSYDNRAISQSGNNINKEEQSMSNPRQKTPKPEPQKQEKQPLPTEITARAYPVTGGGSVLASLTFDINGCFAIRGAKLVQGKNGPFVSMPQRHMKDGYQEVVFPVTREMRELVNSMGLSAYQLAMKDMAQKMEQNQPQQAAPDAPTMSM